MKKTALKILSATVALIMIFGIIAVSRTEIYGAYTPTLYYNDRPWYLSNRWPPENIHGTNYVPITLFLQLPDVDVRVNETLNTFIITHGELYLSFDATSNFVANQDKERMYINTAQYHGERYVPAQIVCLYLDLGYEQLTNEKSGETVIRISDKNASKSFEELVDRYYPDFFGEKDNTDDTTDTLPTTDDDTTYQPPALSERTIYICVDLDEGEYADEILKVLDKYDYRATFFLKGKSLENSPGLLSKIAAAGHEVAIGAGAQDWKDFSNALDIVSYMEAKNLCLSQVVKRKSHLISMPASGVVMSDKVYDELNASGYFTWSENITVSSSAGLSNGVNTAIDGIWANTVSGIRFSEGVNTAKILEGVLKFAKDNSKVCEVRTVTPLFSGYDK